MAPRRASQRSDEAVTPGQAQYVLDRLLREKRIALADVQRYLADLPGEIARTEARLRDLRPVGVESPQRRRPDPQRRRPASPRKPPGRLRARRGGQLQGSYMGYMRQVRDERKKSEFRALKESRGYESAIAAIRKHLGK